MRFIEEVTDPYLNVFRRFMPPMGGGGFALDLSPILAIILLFIAQSDRRRADPRVSSRAPSEAITGWRRALVVCGAVVLLDQVTKAIVVSSLAEGQQRGARARVQAHQHAELGARVRDRQGQGFVARGARSSRSHWC